MSLPPPRADAPAPRPNGRPWHADAGELDRFLDGEGAPAERATRQADRARDPALAVRLERRAGFLRLLASAGAPALADAGLTARVSAALAAEARAAADAGATAGVGAQGGSPRPAWARRRLLPWLATAAVLLVALGVWSGLPGREAEALHPTELAARLLDWKPKGVEGPAGCAGGAGQDVFSFVLVQDGELEIRACDPDPQAQGTTRALLRRPEELPVMGFVAVPAPGAVPSSEVGITEVGPSGVVVFDVLDHGRRVYLALDAAALRLKHAGLGDRWTCAACHGSVRQALPNPHRIVLRQAP